MAEEEYVCWHTTERNVGRHTAQCIGTTSLMHCRPMLTSSFKRCMVTFYYCIQHLGPEHTAYSVCRLMAHTCVWHATYKRIKIFCNRSCVSTLMQCDIALVCRSEGSFPLKSTPNQCTPITGRPASTHPLTHSLIHRYTYIEPRCTIGAIYSPWVVTRVTVTHHWQRRRLQLGRDDTGRRLTIIQAFKVHVYYSARSLGVQRSSRGYRAVGSAACLAHAPRRQHRCDPISTIYLLYITLTTRSLADTVPPQAAHFS